MNTTNVKKMIIAGLLSGSAALAGLGMATGTASAFNPQPEPPGLTQAHGAGGGGGAGHTLVRQSDTHNGGLHHSA